MIGAFSLSVCLALAFLVLARSVAWRFVMWREMEALRRERRVRRIERAARAASRRFEHGPALEQKLHLERASEERLGYVEQRADPAVVAELFRFQRAG